MSEKTLWESINRKMCGGGWEAERIEGCDQKGIPDCIAVFMMDKYGKVTTFMELKDWTSQKKHLLTVEQLGFLEDFGGSVVIKVGKEHLSVCRPDKKLTLLKSCMGHARTAGILVHMNSPNFRDEFIHSLWTNHRAWHRTK